MSNEITPVVHVKDGKVFTNSRDVAEFFGKNHYDVLRDIGKITETLSPQICGLWFQATSYQYSLSSGGRKTAPAYDMSRDGFTLLVMGYTGAKAMGFKVRYIQQFNAMEEALKNVNPSVRLWNLMAQPIFGGYFHRHHRSCFSRMSWFQLHRQRPYAKQWRVYCYRQSSPQKNICYFRQEEKFFRVGCSVPHHGE